MYTCHSCRVACVYVHKYGDAHCTCVCVWLGDSMCTCEHSVYVCMYLYKCVSMGV